MRLYFKFLIACLLFSSLAKAQTPINVNRSAPSVVANDARGKYIFNLGIPVVPDTAQGLQGGLDSLGLIIQIRNNGKQYKRDTVLTGGHKWTEIGTGSGSGADSAVFYTKYRSDTSRTAIYAAIANRVINSGGMKIIGSGPTSSRPAASQGPGLYFDTDSSWFWYSNGTAYTFVKLGISELGPGTPLTILSYDFLGNPALISSDTSLIILGDKIEVAHNSVVPGHYVNATIDMGADGRALHVANGTGADTSLKANIYFRGKGQPGDTLYVHGHDSIIDVAAKRDSIDHHTVINPDSSRTEYVQAHDTTTANALQPKYRSDTARTNLYAALDTKMINFGGAPGQLQGTFSGLPAATSYATGTTYIAKDSGFMYVDTGTGGTRGWKKISGGGTSASANPYILNVLDFGAIPDCNGTSGNGTDNTTAFRNCIAAANFRGAAIYVPPASASAVASWKGYRITDSLLMAGKNIEFYGAGMGQFIYYQLSDTPSVAASSIFFDSPTKNALVVEKTTTNVYPVVRFHDFNLKNISSTRASAGAGIVIRDNNQNSTVINVSIEKFYASVNQISANLITYQHDNFLFPVQYGAIIGNNAANDFGGHHFDHVNIVADTFATTTAIGLYVKNPAAFKFTNGSISGLVAKPNGNFIYGIYADFSDGPTSDVAILNNYFESFQKTIIWIKNRAPSGQCGNIQIANNESYMYNPNSTGFPNMELSNLYNVQIHGNIYGGNTSPFALLLDSITNLSIGGPNNHPGYTKLASISHSTIEQNDVYGIVLNHNDVTDSAGHHTIGNSQMDGQLGIGGQLTVTGITLLNGATTVSAKLNVLSGTSTTTDYQTRLGGWYGQSVAANNLIWADNAYYASGWFKPSTGYSIGINAYNGQFGIFSNNTAAAGALAPSFPFKVDFSNGGSVHLGGAANMNAAGLYSGSSMTVDGSKVRIVPGVLGSGSLGTDKLVVWSPADSTIKTVTGSPAVVTGSDTWAQINDGGVFGSSTDFRFNKTLRQFAFDSARYNLADYQLRLSDIYLQMATANNFNLFDNAKFVTSAWQRIVSGYVEGVNLFSGQIGLSANPTAASGTFTPQFSLKVDDAGIVALGGKNIDMTRASYTGATALIGPDSILITKVGTGNSLMPILVWNPVSHRVDTVNQTGLISGSTPSLQAVLNVGSGGTGLLTKADTIDMGGNNFNFKTGAGTLNIGTGFGNNGSFSFTGQHFAIATADMELAQGNLIQAWGTATDANFNAGSTPVYDFITLPTITANRTISLSTGRNIVLMVTNTAAFTWSPSVSGTFKDAAGNTISAFQNGCTYYCTKIGTTNNWVVTSFFRGGAPIAGSYSSTGTATTTFTVTIGITEPNNTYKINVTPTDALAAGLYYITNKTTTTFDVVYLSGLTGVVSFDWNLTP